MSAIEVANCNLREGGTKQSFANAETATKIPTGNTCLNSHSVDSNSNSA